MVAGIFVEMPRQSSRLRGSRAEDDNQGQDPPPAPQNWQQLFAEMEAGLHRTEEELRQLRQHTPPQGIGLQVPQAVAPMPAQPAVENRWEPLYERFRKQHPPTFEGGPDPLRAEQWMNMISSILDFMRVQGNERVACASYCSERMPASGGTWWFREGM